MKKILLLLPLIFFSTAFAEPNKKDNCNMANIFGVIQLYCGQVGVVIKDKHKMVENCALAPELVKTYLKKDLGNKKDYNNLLDSLFSNKKMQLTCMKMCQVGFETGIDEVKTDIRKFLTGLNCDVNKIFR